MQIIELYSLINWFIHWFLLSWTEVCTCLHPSTPSPVLPAAAVRCHCGLFILAFPFSSFPLQTVDSLSNKKQMGDLCCRLLPNGANSHYNVCKLCLFSPSFTSTTCTTLPSDVFNICFRCSRVILICLVLLITGHLPSCTKMGNRYQT